MKSVPVHRRILVRATAWVVALAVVMKPVPGPAITVFDPWNYAENVLTAARNLEQVNNQITSLANEAQMLINQAKNLASLPTSLASEIEGNFSEMKALLGEAERLAYSVNEIEAQFRNDYRDFGSDLSDKQLFEGAKQRWQESLSAFEHSLKTGAVAVENIDATDNQTGRLVDASQSAVGILEATQAGNQLIAVQSRQLSDLTAMLAAQGRATALEQARQAAAEEQARERFTRFMAGSSYRSSTVKMFHD